MTLHLATVEQLLQWKADIDAEIARRLVGPPPQPVAAAPWDVLNAPRVQGPNGSMPLPTMHVAQPQPAYREPPRRPAIGAGASGHGEPVNAQAAVPFVSRPLERRLPPGTMYPTANTDPELARQMQQIPARLDDPNDPRRSLAPPIRGAGGGQGAVEVEPG